jgi:ribonuclease R
MPEKRRATPPTGNLSPSSAARKSEGSEVPLENQILEYLSTADYQPLDKVGLSKALELPSRRRAQLRATLKQMVEAGLIVLIRKNRYVLPQAANLVTGTIEVHRSGAAHLISLKRGDPDLFIAAENTGTAMNGDTVLVRIEENRLRTKREGHVIRIIRRKNETIVGTLQRSEKLYYVIPDDPHIVRDIYVQMMTPAELPRPPRIGDKVVVKFSHWGSRHENPEGDIVEVLGPASAPGVDLLSIIRKYHLPTHFPDAVLDEADAISEQITEHEIHAREDLREAFIFTIDPEDAKDFDDAIHIRKSQSGWHLGVHIADVSHYVKPDTALDREAYLRGNSVYLVDRVIPMLPEKLSNGICSLRPREDRLTRSVLIDFTTDGHIESVRFAHTVVHSRHRLTYKQAFAMLRERPKSEIASALHSAWKLASILRRNRFKKGSLDLDFPEIKVQLDERGRPISLERIENDISHQLIEEFMLIANEVVARETKNRLFPSVYRIHEDPDPEKLSEFRELAIGYGLHSGDLTRREEVIRLLEKISGHPAEYALKLAFLKSLKRATYDPSPMGHYGLAKTNYTHFTSPIRRYADLVVHRVITLASQGTGDGKKYRISSVDLPECAQHISDSERNAAEAEKESVQLKKLEFFQNQLNSRSPEVFPAVVIDVRSFGLVVELPQFLLTGLIHVSQLIDDFYLFDSARPQFVGRSTRKIYRTGDNLNVIVARVDMYKRQVDFLPAPADGIP